jgi:diacylglycerol kinase
MTRSLWNSFVYALEGIWHSLSTELNIKLFVLGYIVSLILAAVFQFTILEWAIVLVSGSTFLTVELLNTAIERFTDAFDTHAKSQNDVHFEAIKVTKDVAAGAALVAGTSWVVATGVLLYPHLV